MKPSVLLLTSIYDFSADLVALRLKQATVPFVRLTKENLAKTYITMDPTGPHVRIDFAGTQFDIDSSLRSIWFRQPVFLRNTPSEPLSAHEQLSRSQWMAFLRAFMIFDKVKWMNWPQSTYLAECKPYQLLIAKRCGLEVPKTIVGNDAKQFQSAFSDSKFIIKSLDTILLHEGKECLFTYTTQTTSDALSHNTVSSAPFMVQDYVDKKADCRVTIVGDNIFSVRILSDGSPIAGDWRLERKESLQFEDFVLPNNVRDSCFDLVRVMGLSFAAIDLIETNNGYVFLEVNPTGEWGWLCDSKRQIDIVIAKWLSNAPHYNKKR